MRHDLPGGIGLKPKQKIEFIQSFILPKWKHGLAFGRVSIETYQKLDRHARRAACKILRSQPLKRVDPPLDTNGRPWNSKRYVGDVSGEGTANVRSIVDAGIWGAEISVFERKLARTQGLDPCAWRASFNQFRWENGASPLKVAVSKLSPVG